MSYLGELGDRSRGRVPGDILGRVLERYRACPQISYPLIVHSGGAGLGQHRVQSFLSTISTIMYEQQEAGNQERSIGVLWEP